jgi:hypothetical protein
VRVMVTATTMATRVETATEMAATVEATKTD